jgi:uncharacterized damage-inducible protein DinB
MHPRITELLDHLDTRRETLRAAVARVPEEQRDRRPGPDRWSVAEVLEHLMLVDGGVARLLEKRVTEARATGLGAEPSTAPVLDTMDLERLLDRSRPIIAPDRVQPRRELDAATALAALERARVALREAVLAADGLALGELVAPHVVLGPITLYEWIGFVGAHEARHTAQIDEIAAALADTSSPTPAAHG